MAEVRFATRALRSLRGIERYLGERNPVAAERVIEEIGRACALIGDESATLLALQTGAVVCLRRKSHIANGPRNLRKIYVCRLQSAAWMQREARMLLRFSVGNFRSFKERQELSMVASSLKDEGVDLLLSDQARIGPVLPSALVYGSNAAGKSSLVAAIAFMRSAILFSHRRGDPEGGVPRTPFLLEPSGQEKPTHFEIDFTTDSVPYTYGFECSDSAFEKEWLYAYPSGVKRTLYERAGQEFDFGRSLRGQNKIISKLTRHNSLFLSAAIQNDHEDLKAVSGFFSRLTVEKNNSPTAASVNARMARLKDAGLDPRVIEFLRQAGVGVMGYDTRPQETPDKAKEILAKFKTAIKVALADVPDANFDLDGEKDAIEFRLRHDTSNETGVLLDLESESTGTLRLLCLLPSIFRAIESGALLVIDELDASLHTQAAEAILAIFADKNLNANQAQLIATTHDTNLLRSPVLRRDQCWFAEKGPDGGTSLYPLTDFRTRKEDNLEKGYLQGRFGAIPFAGGMQKELLRST